VSCKNVDQAGNNNPLQQAVQPADYTSTVTGDNTLEDITCQSSVYIGAVVYIESNTARNASAAALSTSRAIGIVKSKSSSTKCDIVITGFISSILSGLNDNNNYFLSATVAGAITLTAPSSSGQVVVKIGKALKADVLKVHIEQKTIRT